MRRLLSLLAVFSLAACAQAWKPFLDSSRATDWAAAGFTIPTYTTTCAIQPTLTAGDASAAAANAAAIQKALASCDATHNVVNLPAGTYYVAGWTYGTQGKQVVRGAGPNSTYLYVTDTVPCGQPAGVCMMSNGYDYGGSVDALPPTGAHQCLWTGGYAQGSTTITLSSCGSTPPVNKTLILDQQNDTADTGGQFICDVSTDAYYSTNCTKFEQNANHDGRTINNITHSQQQVTYITGVVNNGNGSYSVTISPGVYFNNIRSSQSPGAWWPGTVQNDGLENLTVDYSPTTSNYYGVTMLNCYQCWMKNVRSMWGKRAHVQVYQSANDLIRDSYFYQSASHGTTSYVVEFEQSSGVVVENNIFQQVTNPLMFGQGSGNVVDYNFSINNIYDPAPTGMQASYYNHNAGNEMNLWEGNNFNGIWGDCIWGSSTTGTLFRNMVIGWATGKTQFTYPIGPHSKNRVFNLIGNVLGQPGYHDTYEAYPTCNTRNCTSSVNGSKVYSSIYNLGFINDDSSMLCSSPTALCDPLVRSTMMRWGNYDTVTGGVKWDTTEASPAAVAYVNGNYTSAYFSALAHTLPASLYYSSRPSWWPSAKAWPPIGPDVSTGNLGTCSGAYNGSQAIASTQCTGGTLTKAWGIHANSIPAQDCFLNVMKGSPDGSGSVLNFDAALCYTLGGGSAVPASPTALTATAN